MLLFTIIKNDDENDDDDDVDDVDDVDGFVHQRCVLYLQLSH